MMFSQLIAQRCAEPNEKVVEQAIAFLKKHKGVNASKVISLAEVSWVVALVVKATTLLPGGPADAFTEPTQEQSGGRIYTRVATSNIEVSDPK